MALMTKKEFEEMVRQSSEDYHEAYDRRIRQICEHPAIKKVLEDYIKEHNSIILDKKKKG